MTLFSDQANVTETSGFLWCSTWDIERRESFPTLFTCSSGLDNSNCDLATSAYLGGKHLLVLPRLVTHYDDVKRVQALIPVALGGTASWIQDHGRYPIPEDMYALLPAALGMRDWDIGRRLLGKRFESVGARYSRWRRKYRSTYY
ncbi:hypothetical protein ARMSODRAFT_1004009 [Armillaria solidipes]|uniref:Uncharacterized protein n=1 Tax=Armillaria solidipes TaxID=1076256 RepID=A0A2H3BG87_9AGAR|nr:hypothetical protein ARMSODRAFT_1004009 [Armillaria solidipes]